MLKAIATPLALLALVGCTSEPESDRVAWGEPCIVAGIGQPARCGQIPVPTGGDAEGGHATVHVVQVLAVSGKRADVPLVLLAGGPGQGASEAFGPFYALLRPLTEGRDVILFDQRGTGRSGALRCPQPEGLAAMLDADSTLDAARACGRDLQLDGGVAPYLTGRAADDLEAVRATLGYRQLDVYGVSYGSRLALTYAERHPDSVRSLILDGVVPPTMRLPLSFARDAQAAFSQVSLRCHDDSACRDAYGPLEVLLQRITKRLQEAPAELELRHPRSGAMAKATLTEAGFAQALRAMLYSPELIALLPLTLHAAAADDWGPFVAQLEAVADGARDSSLGLTLTILCSEDVAGIEEVGEQPGFVGKAVVEDFQAMCDDWPRVSVPPRKQPELTVPTLLLSGELDPVTPPRWADAAAEQLPNHRAFILRGGSHGVLMRACVPRVAAAFLDDPGAVADLDYDCLGEHDELPRFFVGPWGPPP